MKFPWHKYKELSISKRNTLQIFITNRCNLKCPGCFANAAMNSGTGVHMGMEEYYNKAIKGGISRGVSQINILGGEPLLHPKLEEMCRYNADLDMKTTIYTNGLKLGDMNPVNLHGAKLRVSVDCVFKANYGSKSMEALYPILEPYSGEVDINYMVSGKTSLHELRQAAQIAEHDFGCSVFFISSYRELDNGCDFFYNPADEEGRTMALLDYKKLVHRFLYKYNGGMTIHISKRGVFESTQSLPHNRCKFANYLIGGKIIQCPYDLVNLKYQEDYSFNTRFCRQNNTCLMSKIVVRRRND